MWGATELAAARMQLQEANSLIAQLREEETSLAKSNGDNNSDNSDWLRRKI